MVTPSSVEDDLERPAELADAAGLVAPAAERDEVDELADDIDRWTQLAKQHSQQNRTVAELEAELDEAPEAAPEAELDAIPETAPEVEPEPENRTVAELEAELDAIPEAASEVEPEPASAPENRTVAELEAELDAIPEVAPESEPEPAPENRTVAELEAELDAIPEPEPVPGPENRTVAELEAELDAIPEAVPEAEPDLAPEPENRTVAELEAELDEIPEAAPESQPEPAPEPENRTVAELEAELDAIPEAAPESLPEPTPEPENRTVAELEAELDAIPEVAPESLPEPTPEPENRTVAELEAELDELPEVMPEVESEIVAASDSAPDDLPQEIPGDVPGESPSDFADDEQSDPIMAADAAQTALLDGKPAYPERNPALADNLHLNRWLAQLSKASQGVVHAKPTRTCGRLTRAAGLVLEAIGIRLPVGAGCLIELPPGNSAPLAEAEVVGFSGDRLFLMPTTEVSGLLPGARVYPLEASPVRNAYSGAKRLPVGIGMLGRVVDACGRPLDGLGPLNTDQDGSLTSPTINPLLRDPIHEVLDVGVRAINALLTVGRGQRMGLFAGSGVGKSVLLGMMARYTSADVIVVGLIGERGREVKEFIEQILGHEGLARAVVVAAPADVSPLMRMQGAAYATSLAEAFRDEGKSVLLIMDSLTRYAMAQREIALAIGEPPATKGYPPSVFAKLPMLVERAGNGEAGGGSITAFYTVLTEGDDQQDPIADAARAILDGHVVLSRTLAESAHYPAIDIEASISRAMASLVTDAQFDSVRQLKQMLSRYQRNRDLINVGAYAHGRDPLLDRAITLYPRIEAFLQQRMNERCDHGTSLAQLTALVR